MSVDDLLKERKIQLEDLEEEKEYLGELIIRRNKENFVNMVTAKREGDEIWVTRYHIAMRGQNIGEITTETGQEYSREDKEYDELNKKLREAGK